jgi:hypothetical protein
MFYSIPVTVVTNDDPASEDDGITTAVDLDEMSSTAFALSSRLKLR